MRRCVKLVPEGLPVCSALRAPDRFDLAGMPSTFAVKLDSNGGHKPARYPSRDRYRASVGSHRRRSAGWQGSGAGRPEAGSLGFKFVQLTVGRASGSSGECERAQTRALQRRLHADDPRPATA
jgi:hypothetical protein